jgi:alpha-L-fucosidase 2
MTIKRNIWCINVICLLASSVTLADAGPMMLWYDKPASKWVEALPIGNGRLGGMIYGGIAQEHIQFNRIF